MPEAHANLECNRCVEKFSHGWLLSQVEVESKLQEAVNVAVATLKHSLRS